MTAKASKGTWKKGESVKESNKRTKESRAEESNTGLVRKKWERKKKGECRNRRMDKPLIEKRRRERINRSLSILKELVVGSECDKDKNQKMEKADILDLTVEYIQSRLRRPKERCDHPPPFSGYQGWDKSNIEEVVQFLPNSRNNISCEEGHNTEHHWNRNQGSERESHNIAKVCQSRQEEIRYADEEGAIDLSQKSVWRPWSFKQPTF